MDYSKLNGLIPAVIQDAESSEVLMVGDRGAWDGAAVDVGITSLILPPLTTATDQRLGRVLDLVLPGRAGGRRP